MNLSIITINRNNSAGLEKTLKSVASQTCNDFEHIIIDGASTDDSVNVIKKYESSLSTLKITHSVKWVSEPDKGIYNAMNKGIKMAEGVYVQILNSGDCLANDNVVEKMSKALKDNDNPDFLFGNMIKVWPDGLKYKPEYNKRSDYTMFDFYFGPLDHDGAYIKRNLYEKLGFYDESLKICADWKWIINAVVFNGVKPVHADVDTILFDMTGVSENNGRQKELINKEKRLILEDFLHPKVLADYDLYANDIMMMRRIHGSKIAYKLVWFIERCLFKSEQKRNKRKFFYR